MKVTILFPDHQATGILNHRQQTSLDSVKNFRKYKLLFYPFSKPDEDQTILLKPNKRTQDLPRCSSYFTFLDWM